MKYKKVKRKGKAKPKKGKGKGKSKAKPFQGFKQSKGIVMFSKGHNLIPRYMEVNMRASVDCFYPVGYLTLGNAGFSNAPYVVASPYRPFANLGATVVTGNSLNINCTGWNDLLSTFTPASTGGGLYTGAIVLTSKLTSRWYIGAGGGVDDILVGQMPVTAQWTVSPNMQNLQQSPNSKVVTIYNQNVKPQIIVTYTDTRKQYNAPISFQEAGTQFIHQRTTIPTNTGVHAICLQTYSNVASVEQILVRMDIDMWVRLVQPCNNNSSN